MNVYTVLINDGYETFQGVFASDIDAAIWIESQEGYQKGWYEYQIVKSKLGEAVDMFEREIV
jgi:hypothetical protein